VSERLVAAEDAEGCAARSSFSCAGEIPTIHATLEREPATAEQRTKRYADSTIYRSAGRG
jgi:hypothetical protein